MTRCWRSWTVNQSSLTIACLVAWGLVFSAAWQAGPAIESYFFSPVTNISYDSVERDGNRVCWHISLRKVRNASLQRSQYWFERGPERVPLAVYLNRQASFGDKVLPLEPGEQVRIGPYCAELPPVFPEDGRPVEERISNVRVYQGGMPWEFLFSFPDIIVPPAR